MDTLGKDDNNNKLSVKYNTCYVSDIILFYIE